jgi:hypothetical protein
MLLKEHYKSLSGAQRRCAFENANSHGKYRYTIIRCLGDEPDIGQFNRERYGTYTWRIKREVIVP